MKANIATGEKKVVFDANYAKPTLKSGEVLVKILASPINPSDLLNSNGGFPDTKFPVVIGRDYAGEVVEPSSSSWCGKHVYGTSGLDLSITTDGTHAEYVVIPEDALAEYPKNLNAEQAAMVGTPWTTAYLTLYRARAKKGETVLVTGANGSVGSAVVQLAKSSLFGCRVLRAGRGDKYDVNTVADPELTKANELTDGRGPDVMVDTVGDLNIAYAGLRKLHAQGRLAIITTGASRGVTETKVPIDFKELYRTEHSIVGCNSFAHTQQEMGSFLKEISKGFESGELQAPDVSRFEKITLDKAADAYADMSSGSKKKYLIVAE